LTYRKWLFLLALCGTISGCNGSGSWSSGDRVLVSKCAYDTGLAMPQRWNVVVFKWPREPQKNHTPKNYIKRLWGLPGEILAIFFGRVHVYAPKDGQPLPYDDADQTDVNPNRLWERWPYMHENDEKSRKLFEAGLFEILRKPPEVMMALRRIVYDNDYQAEDLIGKVLPRWNPSEQSGWKADQPHSFVHKGDKAEIDWLRYQHLLRPKGPLHGRMKVDPHLITDVLGYNSHDLVVPRGFDFGDEPAGRRRLQTVDRTPAPNWVGDLMLECQVDVAEPKGELYFELSKGMHRFQAIWDLANGTCTVSKLIYRDGKLEKTEEMRKAPTRVKAPGSYRLRVANFDSRVTVWVDKDLPFEDGLSYPPPEVRHLPDEKDLPEDNLIERRGPTKNDLQPASIGSKGARVKVSHLQLWRDTYYTTNIGGADAGAMRPEDWGDPERWDSIKRIREMTMYVQKGHYLVMGDNSPNSSDSREWGTVPERLMLGRALVVYYPFPRAGAIR
jgi:signal peptidase I